MPLSCPQGGGYGGAMGPAQFIPSTWQLVKGRVASMLGISIANPWEPRDAFMASAIYLDDLGAGTGQYTDERNAACRYYSGRACDSKKPANSFYGDSVSSIATRIQTTMIDPLQGL
jgi:membrane-bound lytic murein transglycosylase B